MSAKAKQPASGSASTARASLLGPIAAGFLLDLVDLATYGPIGLWAGLAVGGLTGYFLAASLGVRPGRRLVYALAAGVYCSLPFTALLPAATLLGAFIGFRERQPAALQGEAVETAIEAEYEAHWSDE